MTYTQEGTTYSVSYRALKYQYNKITEMSDNDFKADLPRILHLACIIGWFKELDNDQTLGDKGIIHELVHLLHIPDEPTVDLQEIRQKFNEVLKLV